MGLLKELKRAGEMNKETTEMVILLIRKLASNSPSQIQAIYEAGLTDFLVNNIDFVSLLFIPFTKSCSSFIKMRNSNSSALVLVLKLREKVNEKFNVILNHHYDKQL